MSEYEVNITDTIFKECIEIKIIHQIFGEKTVRLWFTYKRFYRDLELARLIHAISPRFTQESSIESIQVISSGPINLV